jgi:hypothetical protein
VFPTSSSSCGTREYPSSMGRGRPERSGGRGNALSGEGATPSPQPSPPRGEGDAGEPARINTPRHGRATPV